MRLLFLTQVLDRQDAVLGFVTRWVAGLAARCEAVRVVALEVGDTGGLPDNVDWRAVGRRGRVRRYLRYRSILGRALGRDGFDAVLAHMVPRYALVAEGPARRAGAGLFLWYTHAGVDARLRRAVPRVDAAFTASPESLRLEAPNVVVTGHGIDLAHFPPGGAPDDPPRLLSVGRVTPAKDPLVIVEAVAKLVARGRDVHLDLVGGGLAAGDDAFAARVAARIDALGLRDRVARHGAVPYLRVPELHRRASVLVNASHTGSVDKVVLEAMACERPFVSCNDSIPRVVGALGGRAAWLAFPPGDADALAARLEALLDLAPDERARLGADLRAVVARDHEVDALMARLVAEMEARR